MNYPEFLEALLVDGRLRVDPFVPLSADELAAGDRLLAVAASELADDLPGSAPGFHGQAAQWAAVRCYRAAQLIVYRELPAEAVEQELDLAHSFPNNPEVHWSVDLTLRRLPDLLRFAATAAESDPLVTRLRELAQAWPLSSVGIADIGPCHIEGFANSPTLLRLYADRIIQHHDATRLDDPRVAAAVQTAWGGYPELAPKLAKHFPSTTGIEA